MSRERVRAALDRPVRNGDHEPMKRSWAAPVGFFLAGAGLVLAYLAAPETRATELLAAAAPVLAIAAIVGVVTVHRPVRPVPWSLFAVGLALLAVSMIVAANQWSRASGFVFPAGAQAVALLAYPSLFVATISITSDRRHARDLLAGSEPIIYAIALTAMVWVAVTGPYIRDRELPLSAEAWIWIFPLLDGLLALIALRRVDRGASSHLVFETLVLGYLVLGAAHMATGWAAFDGRLDIGSPVAATLMIGPLLIGLVATLPLVSEVTAASGESFRVHWSQIFGLIFAALVPLGALILMLASGLSSTSSFVVVSIATVTVIILALARMWRLVDQVRLLTEQRGHDRLAAMVEHSSDVVMLADQHGRVSYASPGLRATLGYDPESWAGRDLFEIVARRRT